MIAFVRLALSTCIASLLVMSGCEPPPSETNPCVASADRDPIVELGKGVGGAYEAFTDEEVVGLNVAPQGGFGVTVVVRTEGLVASDISEADVQLDVDVDGQRAGMFLSENSALLCREDGGRITGLVVGFDPDVYATNDDLVALDSKVAILDVTVTDDEGNVANVQQPVTISAGG